MGFSVNYRTTRAVSDKEALAIEAAAEGACTGRTWLSCEPVKFFDEREDGALSGFSKPNLMPDPDEAEEAAASGIPDGTVVDMLQVLELLSKKFRVDWEVGSDFGEMGFIRAGVADQELMDQAKELAQGFGEDEFGDDEEV